MAGNDNYNLVLRGEKLEESAITTRDFCISKIRQAKYEQIELEKMLSSDMRTIFTEYVGLFCPDYVDKIDWDYFENLKSMSDNLEIQKNIWKELN